MRENRLQGKSVRVFTDDGLELNGLFCLPTKTRRDKMAVLHIHGFNGNFYQERFVDHIADRLTESGVAFLTVNTRGHDYISYFTRKTDSGLTFSRIGGALDVLEECIYDIKAWIDFLEAHGYRSVILEDESLGTIKVVIYQHQTQDKRVHELVLMSPLNHIGLQRFTLRDRYDEAINVAKQMVEMKRAEEFMPVIYCPLWQSPISARTYISAFDPSAKSGVFNFHDPNARFKELSTIKCPILATYGTVDEAVVGDRVEEALSIIKKGTVSSPRCNTALIHGAPHNYLGYEKDVSILIKKLGNQGP